MVAGDHAQLQLAGAAASAQQRQRPLGDRICNPLQRWRPLRYQRGFLAAAHRRGACTRTLQRRLRSLLSNP